MNNSVAVIGSGIMASGIAAGFIAQSTPVIILARSREKAQSCLTKAVQLAHNIGLQGSYAGKSPSDIESLQTTGIFSAWTDAQQWLGCQWVIETVAEKLTLKQEIFTQLDRCVPESIPIGSNSSGFPITKITEGLSSANRMMGAHYFMPAEVVPLVEIVMGERTDQRIAQAVCEMYRAVEKKPVLVKKDIPGFLANRIQHALMREALSLIQEGIASPTDIDDAVRYSFGFRYAAVGPMTQKEISGWDGMAHAAKEIYPSLSNITELPTVMQELMKHGKTGMKAGEGFRTWSAGEMKEVTEAYGRKLKAAFEVLKMK
jgi:3-hydroxybutyryl-CoA dehydrogenase